MSQANFVYATPDNDAAGLPLTVSIYADRAHLRGEMRDDAQGAGFRVVETSNLSELLDGAARPLGEIVLLDCPVVDGRILAALARLDERASHCGSRLIVSTCVDSLDDVFGCMDLSDPLFLVDPTRADRIIAIAQVLARFPGHRVRELSEEDRLMLLKLTEQVSKIAERIDRLETGDVPADDPDGEGSAFRFEAPKRDFAGRTQDETDRLVRASRPALPDPRLVRRIIRQRQLRGRFFDADLFSDPAWDMLLDLTAARAEHNRVSVTSLCIASGVPPTTALRWIGQMTEAGLFERVEDDTDKRRAFIALTDKAADAMARYFAEVGKGASRLV